MDNDVYEVVSVDLFFYLAIYGVALTINSSHDEPNLCCISRASEVLFEIKKSVIAIHIESCGKFRKGIGATAQKLSK